MAVPNVRIERLCWLAVRDRLASRGRSGEPTMDWLGADLTAGRMASFGFAVHDVAQQLSVAERHELRRTGAVPDWFLPAVYRRRRELRRLGDSGRVWAALS